MLLDLYPALHAPKQLGWKWVREPPALLRHGRSRLRFRLVIVSGGAALHQDPEPVVVRAALCASGALVRGTGVTDLRLRTGGGGRAEALTTVIYSIEAPDPTTLSAIGASRFRIRPTGRGSAFDPEEWVILDDLEFS